MSADSKSGKNSSSAEMTFFEHIDALRPHLFRGGIALIVAVVAAFLAKDFIVDTLLMGPQNPDFPTNRFFNWAADKLGTEALRMNQYHINMINTSMAGQFNLHLRISLVTAFAVIVPYILFELWKFVKPALTKKELSGSRMFVFYVSACFFAGLLFGYFIISPITINFLAGYTVSDSIENMIDIRSYLSTIVNLSLACAVVFQLPLLIFFLAKMGMITATFLRKYRRHAIVLLACIAAIITPPDIFSMILVMLPLYGLYELSIYLSARTYKKHHSEEVVSEATES